MKNYFPILISKKGELDALQYLEQRVKDRVCPVIELLNDSIFKDEKDAGGKVVGRIYSDKLEKFLSTHWNFFGNQIMTDFSLFTNYDTDFVIAKRFINSIIKNGVNVVMVVQNNSKHEYLDFVKDLVKKKGIGVCIRFSNSSGGFLDVNTEIKTIISIIKADINTCSLLFDAGQIDKINYNVIASVVGVAIEKLFFPISKWRNVIVSSSSFPENLTEFSAKTEPHLIPRYEWLFWKTVTKPQKLNNVNYSDYGTKYSEFSDANFRGTVSLKYSTEHDYVIYRGELTDNHKDGHGQYITHCQNLIKSKHYSGKDFSWGDLRYYEVGIQKLTDPNKKTGNATNWVQNSQNHHITLIDKLINPSIRRGS